MKETVKNLIERLSMTFLHGDEYETEEGIAMLILGAYEAGVISKTQMLEFCKDNGIMRVDTEYFN